MKPSIRVDIDLFFDFHIKNGRAVLYPVYKGTNERAGRMAGSRHPSPTFEFSEYTIQLVKDFRRSLDYLNSRSDIDNDRLVFYGFSWAGRFMNIICAVEDRLKASIIICGGLDRSRFARPEVDPINYLSFVKQPRLMLNGRYDMIFPLEISE